MQLKSASGHRAGDVLMMDVITAEAFLRFIETGEAHYWSRSRNVSGASARRAALFKKS